MGTGHAGRVDRGIKSLCADGIEVECGLFQAQAFAMGMQGDLGGAVVVGADDACVLWGVTAMARRRVDGVAATA